MLMRVALQKSLATARHRLAGNRTFDQIDGVNQQALDIVLSGKVRKAFDVSAESPQLKARYGPGWGEQALLARRLIEAGVRFVSLNTGYFDDHSNIERALKDKLPRHDKAVGVLIQDLAERGMLEDTLVIVAGEVGHTPRINGNAGRDHWPQVSCALMAGGGMRTGQAIGATNRLGERAAKRPVHVQEIIATTYHNLGLDPMTTTVDDPTGRPQYLIDKRQPIAELV